MTDNPQWPELPYAAWSDTCDTLQLWTQIAGKVRIALTPLINHWWNATFLVTARGLAAPAMPYGGGTFDIVFDLADHRLLIETSDGRADTARAAAHGGRRLLCRIHGAAASPRHRGADPDHAL